MIFENIFPVSPYKEGFSRRLVESMKLATCNFMAVSHMAKLLEKAGFTRLDPAKEWSLRLGGRYFMVRNATAIFPFVVGHKSPAECGFRIIAAHSDSPGFKLKPNPEIYGDGNLVSLNVEKYGGPIMYTWFDRPLSMASRIYIKGENPLQPEERIVDLDYPVAVIPHLAIHFNRQVNEGNALSVQRDMKPVIGWLEASQVEACRRKGGVVKVMMAEKAGIDPEEILAMETVIYPYHAGESSVGLTGQFIMSPRLDDLSMAFTAVDALIEAAEGDSCGDATCLAAIFDNEETGSGTRQGAAAPTLRNLMKRIMIGLKRGERESLEEDERYADIAATIPASCGEDADEDFYRSLERTMLVSADDAHAWHPNYNDKYDPTNHPLIGKGPVIKINANCKYMTDGRGDALFTSLCREAGVECQRFVNHGDVAGGSTLGNILTSQLDIAGVDVGCAIWAMHSACETGSMKDLEDMHRVFLKFYALP